MKTNTKEICNDIDLIINRLEAIRSNLNRLESELVKNIGQLELNLEALQKY